MTTTQPNADNPSFDAAAEYEHLLTAVRTWIDADVDAGDQDELRRLLNAVDTADERLDAQRRMALEDLRDRFAGTLEFGTAGLRGEMAAGPNRMNRAVVIRAAAGLGTYVAGALPGLTPHVVVGYDARHHSRTFATDTAAVLTAAGIDVTLLPAALPTPVLAFAVRHLGADAGVMVTASHNPPRDNGYKVYLGGRVVTDSGQGAQIVPPYDALIAACIDATPAARGVPRAVSGWQVADSSLLDAYLASVNALSDGEARSLRIVTTSMHGVGGETLATVLATAGLTDVRPVAEQAVPDPDFPTVSFPNPEEPGAMDLAFSYAAQAGADLVIANDPDADRCAVAVHDPRVEYRMGAETARANGWRTLHGDEVGVLLGQAIAQWLAATHATAGGEATRATAASGGTAPSDASVEAAIVGGTDGGDVVTERHVKYLAAANVPEIASVIGAGAPDPRVANEAVVAGLPVPTGADTPPTPAASLGKPVLACSVVSSRLLAKIAAAHGLGFATTLTGFKWISRVPGLVFGYEEALGYCVDPKHVRDKDGLSAALLIAQLANRLKAQGRTLLDALDDLAREHGLHLTSQVSARFADLEQIPATMSKLRAAPPRTLGGAGVVSVADLSRGLDGLPPTDGVQLLAADGTRVIVRPSGTEPKVKCYIEVIEPVAADADYEALTVARRDAQKRLDHVAADIRAALGL